MADQNNTPDAAGDYRDDMVGVLRVLFKRKWLIACGILAAAVLSIVLAMVLPKVYRSKGFFQFSDPSKENRGLLFTVASQLLESSKMVVRSQLKDLGMLTMLKDLNIELIEPEHFHVITIQKFKKYSSAFGNFQQFLAFVKGKYRKSSGAALGQGTAHHRAIAVFHQFGEI